MKKSVWKAKLQYKFDNMMARGPIALIYILVGITAAVVLAIGLLAWLLNREVFGTLGNSIWQNLMHAIDAGTLAGLDVQTGPLFVALMTITTVCGIFITSMLIGIINSGLESKFASLRKGNSKVIESGHTVILGFDSRAFKIISELVEANENRSKSRIVLLGNEDKEVMDDAVRAYIPDCKSTVVICRSGDTADAVALSRCSLETSRSIIINETGDAKTIRTILAAANYLKDFPENDAHITAVVYDKPSVDVAKIAGGERVKVLYFTDVMSRVIAHTCHQAGLSAIYTELFSFEGNEIYIEPQPELVGKTFREALLMTPVSCIIGLVRNGESMLNPPMDTVILPDDQVVLIAQDDGVTKPQTPGTVNESLMMPQKGADTQEQESLLVLGYNTLLEGIVRELDHYVRKGSQVTVACDEALLAEHLEPLRTSLENVTLRAEGCDICDRAVLERFVAEGYRNVVVLSDLDCDAETADTTTLMILLHLRDIAQKTKASFSITSEMQDVRSQKLARIPNVNDFVVSANLTSLITAQVSENRMLAPFFVDLLDEDGSEIYLKPARDYVVTGQPVDFLTLTAAAARRGEVFIGYKDVTATEDGMHIRIVVNPPKLETIVFDENDDIVLIAED